LYNRAFFVDEINRLDRKGPFPVSVILMDLNGLKALNDNFGHAAGDAVLRRAGEILAQTVDRPGCVARIGGDEFIILLPCTGAAAAQTVLDNLMRLTELNNQYHSAATPVRFSVGCATCEAGERMEATIQRADMLMYQSKRAYYDSINQEFSTAE
jgi:diguanylate cyclase (GGDEF)-like protein